MGHFLGALTQARLDEQRGVVQNEKRQGDNQPYAIAQDLITRATYPEEHPYGHSVIGSMDDLQRPRSSRCASGSARTTAPRTRSSCCRATSRPRTRRPGSNGTSAPSIPARPWRIRRRGSAKRTGAQREIAYDRVAAPRLTKVWNIPEYGSRDVALLDIFADVLAADRTARLTKRLVYDDQIATGVNVGAAYAARLPAASPSTVTGKPGADMAAHRAHRRRRDRPADDDRAHGVGAGEGSRAQRCRHDPRSRVDQQQGVDPGHRRDLSGLAGCAGSGRSRSSVTATPAQIAAAARTWLTDGSYSLTILPFEHTAQGQDADRKTMPLPAPGSITAGKFPAIQRATLSNGLKVMLVERHQAPLVSVDLLARHRLCRRLRADKGGHRRPGGQPDGRRHDDARLAHAGRPARSDRRER